MLTPQAPSKQPSVAAHTGPTVRDDIRTKVLIALRWTTLSKFSGQLVSWAVTVYVIRILSPDDYGLMAMASVPIIFFYLLNTVGLDAVLVQKRDLSERLRAQVFGIVILVNLLLFLGFLGGAPWIAAFYHEPRLTAMVRVLGFQFVLLAFETLPQSQLERDFDFGRRSIVELVTIVAGSLTAWTLARAGFGVWTLIWGSLTTTAIRTVGLNLAQRSLCWPRFSLEGIKGDLLFGRSVTVDRALRFILADTDRFIGGKLFGNVLLGYYAVANDLASLPINKLTGLINSIALPAFAKAQLTPAGARSYLLTVTRLMSLLAFPFFLGISSIAPELTVLLLGPKWQAAAIPLQLLSLVMPLRMLMNAFQPFLWGVGRPDTSASTFLIGALTMPVAFVVGAQWGPVGSSRTSWERWAGRFWPACSCMPWCSRPRTMPCSAIAERFCISRNWFSSASSRTPAPCWSWTARCAVMPATCSEHSWAGTSGSSRTSLAHLENTTRSLWRVAESAGASLTAA